MDTAPVIKTLSDIPIGTYIAWGAVIVSIIGVIVAATIKLYKVFDKYRSLKEENLAQVKMLQKHDQILGEIDDSLKKITASLDEQKEVNLKQIRYTIVHTCDEALSDGYISAGKLRSFSYWVPPLW